MVRIGLTGGIGSGKSTVLQMLAQRGAAVIDADAISRSTTAAGGAAIAAISAQFGADFITPEGALDRARMRAHAYADPQARKQLEDIIHPLVGRESTRQVQAALDAGVPCIVFDIPLLVESGRWRAQVEKVLVVDCSAQTQIDRVVARSGLKPDEVRAIMAAQASRSLRLAAADIVICNDGLTLEQLRDNVVQVGRRLGL
jgi:dephospho-CoA kinase